MSVMLDDTACTGCHSQAQYLTPHDHVEKVTGFVHDASSAEELACTKCHAPNPARAGVERLGKAAGAPWGKDQKDAALAAMIGLMRSEVRSRRSS